MPAPDESRGTDVPATLEERIRRWSVYQPWLQNNPVPYWKQMRDHTPIAWSDEAGGYWILTRYEDIEWAARNPEIFSSAEVAIPHRKIFPEKQIPIQLDGEEHRQWRRTLSELFNPSVVNHFAPQIEQAAVEAVERIADKRECEFISEFATALPAETFLIVFGIGREYLEQLLAHKTWLRREGIPNAHTDEEIRAANQPLWEFFGAAIDRRREQGVEGRRDVLSNLILADHEGRPLTRDEMINAAFVSMLASLDTTTAALGNQFLYLAEHPEIRALIVERPEKLPRIAEELIRHEPVSTTGRIVTRDVERHGVTMRAGDRVLMSWGMAGLDPAIFDDPDEVNVERESSRHLAFGIGPHRCLGMHLARRVITIALREWHSRIPDYRVSPGETPVRLYTPGRGVIRLPLTFD
jgi:cytochrome P450